MSTGPRAAATSAAERSGQQPGSAGGARTSPSSTRSSGTVEKQGAPRAAEAGSSGYGCSSGRTVGAISTGRGPDKDADLAPKTPGKGGSPVSTASPSPAGTAMLGEQRQRHGAFLLEAEPQAVSRPHSTPHTPPRWRLTAPCSAESSRSDSQLEPFRSAGPSTPPAPVPHPAAFRAAEEDDVHSAADAQPSEKQHARSAGFLQLQRPRQLRRSSSPVVSRYGFEDCISASTDDSTAWHSPTEVRHQGRYTAASRKRNHGQSNRQRWHGGTDSCVQLRFLTHFAGRQRRRNTASAPASAAAARPTWPCCGDTWPLQVASAARLCSLQVTLIVAYGVTPSTQFASRKDTGCKCCRAADAMADATTCACLQLS